MRLGLNYLVTRTGPGHAQSVRDYTSSGPRIPTRSAERSCTTASRSVLAAETTVDKHADDNSRQCRGNTH